MVVVLNHNIFGIVVMQQKLPNSTKAIVSLPFTIYRFISNNFSLFFVALNFVPLFRVDSY